MHIKNTSKISIVEEIKQKTSGKLIVEGDIAEMTF